MIDQGKLKYMDIQEVAEYCRMTVRTIYNLTSQRKIPFIKPNNGRLLFNKDAIDSWLTENAFEPIQQVKMEEVKYLTTTKGLQY